MDLDNFDLESQNSNFNFLCEELFDVKIGEKTDLTKNKENKI